MKQQESIRIMCEGAATRDYHELEEIQGNLKTRSDSDIDRMRRSIIQYGFSFPFFVWPTKTRNYVLDGHGRLDALRSLEADGYEIPPVPVVWVQAKSKKEAKQKLLRLNSRYGEFSIEGIEQFTADIAVDWDDIMLPSGTLAMGDGDGETDEEYTRKIVAPIYEPQETEPPPIADLSKEERYHELIAEIEAAFEDGKLSEDERSFLRQAATRHLVFDYGQVAEYYAHATLEMQRLMENSALVIIDFDKAIELGFVNLTKRMADLYVENAPDDESE